MKDKMKLGRRDFLKSMGLTGAAATGSGLLAMEKVFGSALKGKVLPVVQTLFLKNSGI